jgi:predicted DCC family thiol-disulfide oxidoreductase YuxK
VLAVADPNLPVLVYDGDCGFCTRSARWVERRLPPSSGASVQPWQRLDLRTLGLTPPDVTAAAWWVDAEGRRHRGHRAAAAALRTIGGAWSVLGLLLVVPPVSWLAAGVYAVVARNRHRMPGSTDACKL